MGSWSMMVTGRFVVERMISDDSWCLVMVNDHDEPGNSPAGHKVCHGNGNQSGVRDLSVPARLLMYTKLQKKVMYVS